MGTEAGVDSQHSGESQFHTAKGECLPPHHGPQHTQPTPSSHQIPLSASHASVPERSMSLEMGGLHEWPLRQIGGAPHATAGFSSGILEFEQKVTLCPVFRENPVHSIFPRSLSGGLNVSYVTLL